MSGHVLVTGGAGFIGVNLACRLLEAGRRVTLVDDFSRRGSRDNARWLSERFAGRLRVIEADVRALPPEVNAAIEETEVVYHLAAQVAVTASIAAPRHDFEVNALGTFNVLEAIRQSSSRPAFLYASTNKVYGKMEGAPVVERNGRWEFRDLPLGADEDQPLDFHSPYGCAKGAGDQYTRDYARIFGLRTVVFRQSCIYGPHQYGIEDQGWVAWFAIRAMQDRPVTLYGDGKQIRDLLYVDDLVDAYLAATDAIEKTSGRVYNVGGGPENTLSLLELVDLLEGHFGRRLEYGFEAMRPGDQPVFVSNNGRARAEFGWTPRRDVASGIEALVRWLRANAARFSP